MKIIFMGIGTVGKGVAKVLSRINGVEIVSAIDANKN